MIVVIQCAASKKPEGGYLKDARGRRVLFVADPEAAPLGADLVYARPDDRADQGGSWRDLLIQYNAVPADNPLGLMRAYRLYENKIYERLAEHIGVGNLYILSAGWGLLRADFLTPQYDITFSQSAEPYKRRKKVDRYQDFRMLPEDADNVVFFGGKDYLPLFSSLTTHMRRRKVVFYNSGRVPEAPGCALKRFETSTRTNWHYECANAFLEGRLDPDGAVSHSSSGS